MSLGEMISAILANLPVGFGFRPTDEELVDHYLKLKIQGKGSVVDIIPVIDVCEKEPWQLPDLSVIKTSDPDWFFFNPIDYKYSNGSHVKRQTGTGYWKPTGQDREIKSGTKKIGTKKTLVFYKGRGQAAVRTNWVIHEYRTDIASLPNDKAYVLCHLKKKTDENTGSDIPVPDEDVAGGFPFSGFLSQPPISQENPGTGLPSNMAFGVGPSILVSNIPAYIRNYEEEEMLLDDPELQGLLHETTFPGLDRDLFPHTEQRCDLDFSSPSGFTNSNSYGSMQFQDGDCAEFTNSLFIDSDGYPCERSSAVNRLSARPQSPLRGAYGKGGRSSTGTDTEVLHVKVKDSVLHQASSYVVSGSKECMQSSMATSGLSNTKQLRKENSVAEMDAPKGVKLEGNDLDDECFKAKLARLTKLEENSVSSKAKDKAEYSVAQMVALKGVKLEGNDSDHESFKAKLARLTKLEENSVSIKTKDEAEYSSATHLHQTRNPIKESKKETEVTQKANPKVVSMTKCNELVGSDQKGGNLNSPEQPSAIHESSCSQAQLVNLLVGIIMLVSLIVVMMLDIVAKF